MRPLVLPILFLFFINFVTAFAQPADVSILQSNLETAEGRQRIDILNSLTDKLIKTNPKQAEKYADEAYKLSTKGNYQPGIIASSFSLSILERDKGRSNRAIKKAQEGIAAAQSVKNQPAELYGLEILKTIYMKVGDAQALNEVELELKRLNNTIDLEKRNQQYSNLDQQYKQKEQALLEAEADNTRIASENEKIQEELRQLQIQTLQEKVRLDSLEKEKVELELEAVQSEKAILETSADLKREQHIKTILIIVIIVAILGIFGVTQYYRLKRLRAADKAKAQRQLIMQEKMAALGQLTAGMAHEIQNPLNFVKNFAEGSNEMAEELEEVLTAAGIKPTPDQLQLCKELTLDLKQNSSDIIENGKRISRIVRSMMEHARGNKGQIESTDINLLVKQSLNLAYHGYCGLNPDFNATLEESYDESLVSIDAIATDLSRVFINIFSNACHALHQKQKNPPTNYQPTLSVRTEAKQKNVIIYIRDNGPGIPEDIQPKIFAPFFSTKSIDDGNSGLGLSISYDIVVQGHHGQLEMNSEPGEFTEFVVQLPK